MPIFIGCGFFIRCESVLKKHSRAQEILLFEGAAALQPAGQPSSRAKFRQLPVPVAEPIQANSRHS
jgi:hypothetical protein